MTSAPAPPRAGGARHRGGVLSVLAAGPVVSVTRLLVAVTVVKAAGLGAFPQRGLDEGVSVASAVHILDAGWPGPVLGPSGPLGAPALWQLAGLARVSAVLGSDVLDAAPSAVAGGRALVLPLAVLSAGLLWVLARRAGLGGGAAAVAVVAGALSPLAVSYHRVVTPEVIALPWALAGLALVAVRPTRAVAGEHSTAGGRPRPSPGAALAGSGLLAVAAATSPLTLLLVPLALAACSGRLGLPDWRTDAAPVDAPAPPPGGATPTPGAVDDRLGHHGPDMVRPVLPGRRWPSGARSVLVAACSALVLAGTAVGVRAAGSLDADLEPGARGASGLSTSTSGARALRTWVELDVVVPLLVLVLVVAAVRVGAWRPHAVAAVLPVLAVVALGLPAASAVVVVVPWALLVAAGTVRAVTARAVRPAGAVAPGGGEREGEPREGGACEGRAETHPPGGSGRLRWMTSVRSRRLAPLAAAVVLVVGTGWVLEGRAASARGDDTAAAAAVLWLARTARGQGVLADPSIALDLERLGLEVLTAIGPDGRVRGGIAGAAWLVETSSVREAARDDALTRQVLTASAVARVFGTGTHRVAVLELPREPSTSPPDPAPPGAPPPGAPPPSASPPSGSLDLDLDPPQPDPREPDPPQPDPPQPDPPAPAPPGAAPSGVAADQRAVAALLRNPRITFSPTAAQVLSGEPVDVVLLAVLATTALDHELSVVDLPAAPGRGVDALRTSAVLDLVDGAPVTAASGIGDDVVADLTARASGVVPIVEVTATGAVGPGARQLLVRLPPTPAGAGAGGTTTLLSP